MLSDASPVIAATPENPPPSASSNFITAANAIPASTSANFTPTSPSENPHSKGSESIASPTKTLPFTELHLVHHQMFSREATASGSPAWLQVKPLWETWGNKVAFLDVTECDISLSPGSPKPDVKLPSALTSAMSIAQIYLALQLSDPHKPNTPPVQVSPTCHLDDLHPHHHLRQVVEGILDVKTPLPSAKAFESNMLLSIEGLDAFFGSLEISLGSFVNELTSSEQTLRYAEVEFFTSLRLALFVKGTTFMRDEGDQGPSLERVNSLMDRLVSVLAGIAVLRYMQEYLGGALARWTREESDRSSTRWEMWYTFLQLWKAGMSGLASALSQGRKDLFQYRAIGAIISPSVKSIVDHLMTNPAWWSPHGDGVPVAFRVGLKQFVPSEALFEQLRHIQWPRLSFLDRASVLLLLFICAIQISQEPGFSTLVLSSMAEDPTSLVFLFIACSRDLRVVIEGTEEGPKYSPDASENEIRRRQMVDGWIKVWRSERGPESPAGSEATLFMPPSARATVRIPLEEPEPMDLDEPEIVRAGGEVDSRPKAAQESAPSQEEDDVQPADEEGDPEADIAVVAGKKRKRKVPVGGRRIAGPSVGLAENPRQRLKEVAATAPEQEVEERPRRKAYLNSPFVSGTQGSRTDQSPHLEAKHESSRKPRAIKAKAKAAATASAPSSSPRKLTARQISVEAARKAAQAKAAKNAAGH
ncbi:hypothetical protein FS837_009966 [Tulasnella sp. UAMH 9824]|nr:hypothetical protein FS837_009966 [Tulasnella sp. UAMH 9824]